MRSAAKQGGGGRGGGATESNSRHIQTLHRRLLEALKLGHRCYDDKEAKWQCTDIEIQRHVLRSIASFLTCISGDNLKHPLVKDSVADMLGALVWILQQRSEAVLGLAGNVVVKLIRVMPNSILQSYLLELVHPLSSLLSSLQLEVSISCATALGMIFSNLIVKREKRVWEMLVEAEIVSHLTNNLREFSCGTMPIEYFQEMASLLSIILHQWPASRYSVWNDVELMEALQLMLVNSDFPVKATILKLYSGIALCAHGSKKLLEEEEALLQLIVLCMGRSYPPSSRIEAFRLARYLATNEQGCSKMMNISGEPLVEAIIAGLSGRTLHLQKLSHDQMSLLVEACRLALIIRWPGKHHKYFWKQGIDKVLLDLLLENNHNGPSQHFSSLDEQISRAQDILNANFLIVLRPYVWEILGWLATYCSEDCNLRMHGHENCINILITCACLSFANSIRQAPRVCQADAVDTSCGESALRAVFLMIYSSCKYIASKTKVILSEILRPTGKEYLKQLLLILNITSSRDSFVLADTVQGAIKMVALTCYSALPQYQSLIVKRGAIKILMAFIRQYLSNNEHTGRLSLTPHLHNFSERRCCWVHEDWEGDNILSFYCLRSLAELLHSASVANALDTFDGEVDSTKSQFVKMLQEICTGTSAPGLKWYAAFVLSYFGYYGFPSKLGNRVGKVLGENQYADIQFILTGGQSVDAHGVIIAIQCPSLFPPEKLPPNEKAYDISSASNDLRNQGEDLHKGICLSSHVDKQSLAKLLEFVYLGYLQANEEIARRLKLLAKHCSLQPLVTMLGRRRPKWGKPFPSYDLSLALTPTGHSFSYGLLLDF
uniref:BTB/POZ domain-containing protein At1g04390 isoform X2 n=1 Tax=Rhizophora mucronata TaxID=61149 RepID=A0A2P2KLU7_RHIMU